MTAAKWDFSVERCALLVIDMQNDFVREDAIMEVKQAKHQLPAIKKLIDTCRKLDVPVIYTVHETDSTFNPLEIATFPHLIDAGMRAGTEGIEVVSELKPADGEYVLSKRRYSAFYQTDLEIVLRNIHKQKKEQNVLPVDTLIICGTVTNICCESTARDAYFRDYKVIFGSDVCSALNKEAHDATLANMELFGQVLDCEEIIAKLEVD